MTEIQVQRFRNCVSDGEKGCACSVAALNSQQTSWIMFLITIINESNLHILELTAKILGRICSVGTSAV